jgi:23S rRNA pseudouridine2605 synthase
MSEPEASRAMSEETTEGSKGQRISRAMARVGLCSRRDAEGWIEAGRVSVNGRILASPAFNVGPDDDIRVDGERIPAPERTRLFFFNKPRGLVTTARDPEGRATVFDALPKDMSRVISVGRLDINTEGLLLLTNDGGLARLLELPATGWLRRYRVRAHGEIRQAQLDRLIEGVTIEGVHYAGVHARLERQQGSNVWLIMGLREGKNREIRRLLEYLGLSVSRLIRISFGPFELGELPEGAVLEVNTRVLRDQLGPKLAAAAGVDFDAPIGTKRIEEPPPRHRAPRPNRGDRPHPPMRTHENRAEIARELAARGERPETKTPRKRKHVSALRADARAEQAGSRKRTARTAATDRKGREISVERLIAAPRALPSPPEHWARGSKRGYSKRPVVRAEQGKKGSYARFGVDNARTDGQGTRSARAEGPVRKGTKRPGRGERGRGSAQTERRSERDSDVKYEVSPLPLGGQKIGKSRGRPTRREPPPRT